MKNRNIIVKFVFSIVLIFAFLFIISNMLWKNYQPTCEQIEVYATKEEMTHNDLIEGYEGNGYNLEAQYYLNNSNNTRVIDYVDSCNQYCLTHGPGRSEGGDTLLSIGCRNYKGWSYGSYGRVDIPFWINMDSINTITNTIHRNLLITDIREQAQLWNEVEMHDGSGLKINLYEVGIGESTRPADINGLRVVEFLRQDGDYAGQFSVSDLQIMILWVLVIGQAEMLIPRFMKWGIC